MDDLEELLYEKAFVICGCGAALPQTCFPKNGVKNGVQLYRNICGRCNTERVKDAKRRKRNADEAKEAERQENVQVSKVSTATNIQEQSTHNVDQGHHQAQDEDQIVDSPDKTSDKLAGMEGRDTEKNLAGNTQQKHLGPPVDTPDCSLTSHHNQRQRQCTIQHQTHNESLETPHGDESDKNEQSRNDDGDDHDTFSEAESGQCDVVTGRRAKVWKFCNALRDHLNMICTMGKECERKAIKHEEAVKGIQTCLKDAKASLEEREKAVVDAQEVLSGTEAKLDQLERRFEDTEMQLEVEQERENDQSEDQLLTLLKKVEENTEIESEFVKVENQLRRQRKEIQIKEQMRDMELAEIKAMEQRIARHKRVIAMCQSNVTYVTAEFEKVMDVGSCFEDG